MHTYTVQTAYLHQDSRIWDDLQASAPDATVFSSGRWLRMTAEQFGREPLGVVLMRDGEPVAGIPLLTTRKSILRLSTTVPITLYAGWTAAKHLHPSDPAIMHLLQSVERRCHYISLTVDHARAPLQQFRDRGWHLHMRHTRKLILDDPEGMWEDYSQSLRRKIRRAEESGLSIEQDPSVRTLADCYGESYQRHGITPPIPQESIEQWLTELRREGLIASYAAIRADGRCAASRVLIRDGDVLYDWLAGSNPTLAASASHWLLHSLLKHYAGEGVRVFDFMGSNTPGVSDFKRSFGGNETDYLEAEWYRPRLLRQVNILRGRQLRRRRGLT